MHLGEWIPEGDSNWAGATRLVGPSRFQNFALPVIGPGRERSLPSLRSAKERWVSITGRLRPPSNGYYSG